MAEYHVGCGLAGIYAGTIKKPGEWKNKSEVTEEALRSVAAYMLRQLKPGDQAYEMTWTNQTTGNKIVLICYREGMVYTSPKDMRLQFFETQEQCMAMKQEITNTYLIGKNV